MCHQVTPNGTGSFLAWRLTGEAFVGVKRLAVHESELFISAVSMLTRYEVYKPTNERYSDTVLVTTEKPITKQ